MSEIKTLEIPKWGLSMEEGTIAQWLIEPGNTFSKEQEICEIETTKIVNVLEAPFDGTLRKILAHNGDTLVVGGVIAICADNDVSDAEVEAYAQSFTQTTASVKPTIETKTVVENVVTPTVTSTAAVVIPGLSVTSPMTNTQHVAQGAIVIPAALQGYQQLSDIFITPHALKLAEKHNINLMHITGSGRHGRVSVSDLQSAVRAAGGVWLELRQQGSGKAAKSTADDSQVAATPVARRLAKQWNINLHDCRASGSRGRICRQDVEAVYQRENPVQVEQQSLDQPANAVTVTAMNTMRKAIASRLQAAKRNAPHFRLTVELNVEAIQSLRQQINATVPQVKLSINDMLIKAAAAALIKVPQVNVQFDEDKQQILQFEHADIAVAVAIDHGLITPIIKAANQKSLAEISNDMRDLATRAKTGKLAPDEFQGGSFSISNLGMLGVQQFDAIINPPQGAILALGAAEKRAVVVNDTIQIAQMVSATLSCDHRVIDGALGAKFLAAFKQFVEHPALMLV